MDSNPQIITPFPRGGSMQAPLLIAAFGKMGVDEPPVWLVAFGIINPAALKDFRLSIRTPRHSVAK